LAAKRAIKKALEYQINYGAYSFVELLSACPTNWRMSPTEAIERVGKELAEYFPLGVFIDKRSE
jgi:2-oxoglutarate ferredoxin oxidoreductase subunit beta